MRINLSKMILATVAVAAVAVTATTAKADTRVNVPFTFSVDGKICPAGEYVIERTSFNGLVTLQSKDAKRHFSWILVPNANDQDKRIVLKFDQFGENKVLNSVQYGQLTTHKLDKKFKETPSATMAVGQGQ